jgi:hypothetical protein
LTCSSIACRYPPPSVWFDCPSTVLTIAPLLTISIRSIGFGDSAEPVTRHDADFPATFNVLPGGCPLTSTNSIGPVETKL